MPTEAEIRVRNPFSLVVCRAVAQQHCRGSISPRPCVKRLDDLVELPLSDLCQPRMLFSETTEQISFRLTKNAAQLLAGDVACTREHSNWRKPTPEDALPTIGTRTYTATLKHSSDFPVPRHSLTAWPTGFVIPAILISVRSSYLEFIDNQLVAALQVVADIPVLVLEPYGGIFFEFLGGRPVSREPISHALSICRVFCDTAM